MENTIQRNDERAKGNEDPLGAPIDIIVIFVLVIVFGLSIRYSATPNNLIPTNASSFNEFLANLAQLSGALSGILVAILAFLAQGRKITIDLVRAKNYSDFFYATLRSYFDLIIMGVAALFFILVCFNCTMHYANNISSDVTLDMLGKQMTHVLGDFVYGMVLLGISITMVLTRKIRLLMDQREKYFKKKKQNDY